MNINLFLTLKCAQGSSNRCILASAWYVLSVCRSCQDGDSLGRSRLTGGVIPGQTIAVSCMKILCCSRLTVFLAIVKMKRTCARDSRQQSREKSQWAPSGIIIKIIGRFGRAVVKPCKDADFEVIKRRHRTEQIHSSGRNYCT